ncbi:MAG TPA: hypothetical protein VGL77_11950 [Armatimonadota bacterium]|jgi:hypothetical protein
MAKQQMPFSPHPPPPVITRRISWRQRIFRCLSLCEITATFCLLCAAGLALFLFALGVNGQMQWPYIAQATKLFVFMFGAGATLLLVAQYRALWVGWLGIFFGMLFANCPVLIAMLAAHLHFVTETTLLVYLYGLLPGLGKYLLILSVLQIILANIDTVAHSRVLIAERFRPARADGNRATSRIPQCWEMYACPDGVREKCPNYLDKMTCWKRRRGCYCDHQLASFLYRQREEIIAEPEKPYHLDLTHVPDIESYPARMRSAPPRSWHVQRDYCHNCAVYLEHQGVKYRRYNWIFLPITLVLVAFCYRSFHFAYNVSARFLDVLSKQLTVSGHLPAGFSGDASSLVGSPYEYVLLFALSLLLMSYVVEWTDRCLLEWMW